MDQSNLAGGVVRGLYEKPVPVVVSANAGVVTRVSSESRKFNSATIYGGSNAGVDNTSTVRLGLSGDAGNQPMPILSGKVITIQAPPEKKYDLMDFYFKTGTNGDGLVFWLN